MSDTVKYGTRHWWGNESAYVRNRGMITRVEFATGPNAGEVVNLQRRHMNELSKTKTRAAFQEARRKLS